MESYRVDHDIHLHSFLSACSVDPEQTAEAILKYGEENGYRYLCMTDHGWSEHIPCKMGFYESPHKKIANLPYRKSKDGRDDGFYLQKTSHVREILPLPQGETTKFYFGVETDMDEDGTLGMGGEDFSIFDFVIVPTTHLHMFPFRSVGASTEAYVTRMNHLLEMDLPFDKIGIAHLACSLIAPNGLWHEVLDGVTDAQYIDMFQKVARCGAGVEINADDFDFSKKTPEEVHSVLRVFRFAKECGCRFYLGSDAHHPGELRPARAIFENAVRELALTEADKFCPFREA